MLLTARRTENHYQPEPTTELVLDTDVSMELRTCQTSLLEHIGQQRTKVVRTNQKPTIYAGETCCPMFCKGPQELSKLVP